MSQNDVFSRLMEEYGKLEEEEEEEEREKRVAKRKKNEDQGEEGSAEESGVKKGGPALMQIEERNTGAVTWDVYRKYLGFAGGVIWAPFILILLTLTQGAQGPCLSNLIMKFVV